MEIVHQQTFIPVLGFRDTDIALIAELLLWGEQDDQEGEVEDNRVRQETVKRFTIGECSVEFQLLEF